jgi:uncharacterized protein YbjT (DUF2867 family)
MSKTILQPAPAAESAVKKDMSESRVVIVGATGMIGGLILRNALADPGVGSVLSVGRRPTGAQDPKLRELQCSDFSDFSSIEDGLTGLDVAYFCMGAYTGTVPDQEFKKITVDYTLAFARALHGGSPGAAFCLLSGQGADQSEKSRISFSRYKGMAENGLLALGFPRTHLFRPGYIYPVTPRTEPNLSYRAFRALWPALRRVYPNMGISSDGLARAMLFAGLNGTTDHDAPVLENRDIRRLAAEKR